MWIAEIAERAILSATSGIDCTFRASRVDDEPTNPIEHKNYPSMIILADGGMQQGNINTHYDLPCSVTLATLIVDDEKRTALAQLESDFRNILDQGIATEFNAVSSSAGESWYLQGIVDITGGGVEIVDNKEQVITTTMTFKICGSFSA